MILKLIRNEIIRILGNYRMWLLLLTMTALNACVFLVSFSIDEINPEEYREIKAEIKESPDVIVGKYYNDETGSDVISLLYTEYISTEQYGEYLQYVQETVDNGREISIFLTEFSQKNFDKTEADYAGMHSVEPVFVGGYGVEGAVSFPGSDVIVFIIIIITVNVLFIQDKKSGMTDLTRSAARGGAGLLIAKTASVFLYIAIFFIVIYISDIMLGLAMYGQVDFAAPVQSLLSYAETAVSLNIGEFLTTAFFVKLMMYFFVSAAVILFAVISSNEIFLYACTALFGILEFSAYAAGRTLRLEALYHMSIPHVMSISEFYAYYNYNLFNAAVSDTVVDVLAFVIMTLALISVSAYIYSTVSLEYRSFSFYRKKKKSRRMYGLPALETQKFLFGYKIIFFILAVIAFSTVLYVKKDVRWNMYDIYYRDYMKLLEGEITDEKKDFIDSELQKMEAARAEQAELEYLYAEGEISPTDYEYRITRLDEVLFRENIIIECRDYMSYLETLDTPDAEMVYDRGWNYILGGDEYEHDINHALIMVLAVILGASFMYAEEYKYRMNSLTDISAGKKKGCRIKAVILLLYIVFIYITVYLPEMIWIANEFGLSCGHADIKSFMRMSELDTDISIWGYYGLVTLIRLITLCITAALIRLLCKYLKNTNRVIIISIILFMAPLMLNMLGINAFDKYTANWLLSGNMFLETIL